MKKIRKVTPGKQKQDRKDVQEDMVRQVALFSKHPTECCICKLGFERTKETVLSWQITINEERVRLTCPRCWGIIKEALESKE